MIKKIIILGSTGSIGSNIINIITKDKNFKVELLSANKNIKKLFTQAKKLNVKKIIITDKEKYFFAKNKYSKSSISIYNSFDILDKILKKNEIYYTMISITGLDGLYPALKMIKFSKNIAIANKESIICAWNLIKKQLLKYNTNFIPIDSEHFSIFSLTNGKNYQNIQKVYLTASGGPFLNKSINFIKRAGKSDALMHPIWKMGKKISIDSSTMMNKVFEVIEAKKIFNLEYKQIEVLSHPKSYVHSIVTFKNFLTKILIHQPNMKIPIYNSLYKNQNSNSKFENLNLSILNNLDLKKIDKKKFPLINILSNLKNKDSLYETIIVTVNDYFVVKFLNEEISYIEMINLILKYSNLPQFLKFRNIKPKNVEEIDKIRSHVSLKLKNLSI